MLIFEGTDGWREGGKGAGRVRQWVWGGLGLAALMVVISAAASAQAPPARADTVTLADALRRAVVAAPRVGLADAEVGQGRAEEAALRRRRRPTLAAGLDATQRYGLAFDQTAGALTQSSIQQVGVGVDARYALLRPGRRAETEAAEAGVAALQARADAVRWDVASQTIDAFVGLLVAQGEAGVERLALAEEADLLATIQALVGASARPPADLYRQQAAVAARRRGLSLAQRGVAAARVALAATLGDDPLAPLVAAAPAIPDTLRFLSPPPARVVLDSLLAVAERHHPAILAARAGVVRARRQATAARAERQPAVDLTVRTGTGYSSAVEPDPFAQFGRNRSAAVGLSLSVPLGAWVGTPASVRLAVAELARAERALDVARAEVEAALARDVILYVAVAEEARLALAQLALATQAVDVTRVRYAAGDAAYLELSQARSQAVIAAGASARAVAETFAFRERLRLYAASRGAGRPAPGGGEG